MAACHYQGVSASLHRESGDLGSVVVVVGWTSGSRVEAGDRSSDVLGVVHSHRDQDH